MKTFALLILILVSNATFSQTIELKYIGSSQSDNKTIFELEIHNNVDKKNNIFLPFEIYHFINNGELFISHHKIIGDTLVFTRDNKTLHVASGSSYKVEKRYSYSIKIRRNRFKKFLLCFENINPIPKYLSIPFELNDSVFYLSTKTQSH